MGTSMLFWVIMTCVVENPLVRPVIISKLITHSVSLVIGHPG